MGKEPSSPPADVNPGNVRIRAERAEVQNPSRDILTPCVRCRGFGCGLGSRNRRGMQNPLRYILTPATTLSGILGLLCFANDLLYSAYDFQGAELLAPVAGATGHFQRRSGSGHARTLSGVRFAAARGSWAWRCGRGSKAQRQQSESWRASRMWRRKIAYVSRTEFVIFRLFSVSRKG